MNTFLEILKYTLPAVVVFLTAFFMIRFYLVNEDRKRRTELTMNYRESTLPLRLQAYERLILFLERITPDALVVRLNYSELTVAQLQNELTNAVRTEFEHNLTQQTYISSNAWEMVKSAKNNVIKLINESAAEFKADAKGINLSKNIIENSMQLQNSPVYSAIEYLKKEVREMF